MKPCLDHFIGRNHCRLGTRSRTCSFGDALSKSWPFGPCQSCSEPYACPFSLLPIHGIQHGGQIGWCHCREKIHILLFARERLKCYDGSLQTESQQYCSAHKVLHGWRTPVHLFSKRRHFVFGVKIARYRKWVVHSKNRLLKNNRCTWCRGSKRLNILIPAKHQRRQ